MADTISYKQRLEGSDGETDWEQGDLDALEARTLQKPPARFVIKHESAGIVVCLPYWQDNARESVRAAFRQLRHFITSWRATKQT